MKHMIASLEIAHAFHRGDVARVTHDAKHAVVTLFVRTNRAGIVHRVIAADGAILHSLAPLPDSTGKLMHLILGERNDVIRQPLRGLGSDTGQAGELLRHARDGFNLPSHNQNSPPMPAAPPIFAISLSRVSSPFLSASLTAATIISWSISTSSGSTASLSMVRERS